MKVYLFAEPGHMQFFWCITTNLSYDQKYRPFRDHTNVIYELQLLIEPCTKTIVYVHQSQAISISYTFLVADYWSSTATLSYKSLCTVWWSVHLASGFLHCSKCCASTEQKKKRWGVWVQLVTTPMCPCCLENSHPNVVMEPSSQDLDTTQTACTHVI